MRRISSTNNTLVVAPPKKVKSKFVLRRSFLRSAVASAILIIGSGALAGPQFRWGGNDRSDVKKKVNLAMTGFDRIYLTNGKAAIEQLVLGNNVAHSEKAMDWIVNRKHIGLYDLIVKRSFHDDEKVQLTTMACLDRCNARDLRLLVDDLEQNQQETANPLISELIGLLLVKIEKS